MNIIQIKKIILVIGDLLLLYCALLITIMIRYGTLNQELWTQHAIPFTLLFIIWIIVFFINNLYTVQLAKNDFSFYSYLIENLLINTLIGFTFFYLSPVSLTSLKPFRVLIILILIYAALFVLWRLAFYRLTSSKTLSNRVLFIGVNQEAIQLAEYMEKNPQLGYALSLVINLEHTPLPVTLQHIPHLKELADLTNTIKKNRIQTVVTIANSQQSPTVSRYLFETLSLGLNYYNFPTFYEKLTGKIPVASLEKNWFLENLVQGNKRMFEVGKRLMDIIFCVTFGAIAIPLLPFIMLAVKLSSNGPLLYSHIRTGKGGKTFRAIKFRTMIVNAEQNGAQWTTKNDPRVTKIGRILRKTRLDEIPQFLNILSGDMSFVGPRPERPEFVSILTTQIPFYKERLLVKPGLTGWAQINYKYGESVEDAITKLQYDLFYIKNRSFTLDVSIILKTLNTIFNASLGQ